MGNLRIGEKMPQILAGPSNQSIRSKSQLLGSSQIAAKVPRQFSGTVFACSIAMITLVIATTAVIGSATAPERPIKDCIIEGREMRCVIMNGPDGAVVVP
jgi:hypothetical protein